jgi:prepilin-type N-terminal cleavage/methylation domain-containing protein/prepilin-type processing-associated H-X9-DG protein
MKRRPRRFGFTLIEILVVIAIIGLLLALLLPAVQSAREASRRAQCTGNLKQLALAALQYHDSVGCLPMGAYFSTSKPISSCSGPYTFALLPYIEQRAVFDAINFNVAPDVTVNSTIHGIGIATLWCPSDPTIALAVDLTSVLYDDLTLPVATHYCSYAANCGTSFLLPDLNDPYRAAQLKALDGVLFENSSVRLTDIVDGTGSTILFGERSQDLISPPRGDRWHWWTSSSGLQFTSMWPPNPQRVAPDGLVPAASDGGSVYVIAASSNHPGGANFAFADGSVHFIKDTIDSWPLDPGTGDPVGVTFSFGTGMYPRESSTRLGVYQALSTRKGREIVADLY